MEIVIVLDSNSGTKELEIGLVDYENGVLIIRTYEKERDV
jgi:hypothetical protein